MPILRGSNKLEKMAYRMSWLAGKSGKHIFLKDVEDEKPPLLLQMVTDYGGLHFMYAMKIIQLFSRKGDVSSFAVTCFIFCLCCRSALRSFKRRVVYSNVCNDCILVA